MRFKRASGILLHPTSLPGRYSIGDLGVSAFEFVDFLAHAGQTYWQILPLAPAAYGDSPYSAYSAFAGNNLLISPETLVQDKLLPPEAIENTREFHDGRVDYGFAYKSKNAWLGDAFETFRSSSDSPLKPEFNYFCHENAWWLDDYGAFRVIRNAHDQKPWFEWTEPLRKREAAAIATATSQLTREIQAEKFSQFIFFRQWHALKSYANERGVLIIGDIPIFVALDSADVWCNQDKFKLGDDGLPKVVAGVPPDFFSNTGQLWGNPIYDWQAMMADNFNWWTARVAFALRTVDIIRLDHFIGFARNWEVPGQDKTAENGEWMDVPGHELFSTLNQRLGELPVIAEDLGSMTTEIENLRDTYGFPGMRILQYAFGGDANNRDLPHNYVQNSVAYTGTHDNNTTAGWYKSADKNARNHCRKYLSSNGREIHWDMIRAAFSSVADTAIIPGQDLLGLGTKSRMNTPATADGNWQWRLKNGELNEGIATRLREMTEMFGRTR